MLFFYITWCHFEVSLVSSTVDYFLIQEMPKSRNGVTKASLVTSYSFNNYRSISKPKTTNCGGNSSNKPQLNFLPPNNFKLSEVYKNLKMLWFKNQIEVKTFFYWFLLKILRGDFAFFSCKIGLTTKQPKITHKSTYSRCITWLVHLFQKLGSPIPKTVRNELKLHPLRHLNRLKCPEELSTRLV